MSNQEDNTNNASTNSSSWNLTDGGWNNYSDYYPIQDEFTINFYYYLWMFAAPIAFGLITLIGTVGNSLVVYVILSK